jgi:protein TorT
MVKVITAFIVTIVLGLYLMLGIANANVAKHPNILAKTLPRVCAVYPHLKDSYWLSINFGMIEQAKQSDIQLKVLESGGYGNSEQQLRQIKQCLTWQADAILVGAVYFDSVSEQLELINQKTPIFALVNELSSAKLTASTGVSWYEMGFKLGDYLVRHHATNYKKQTLAWFPGPKGGGGSPQSTLGLQTALTNSDIEIVTVKYGLNEKITQFALIKAVLEQYPDIDYLAGNAVMAEMAISEVIKLPQGQQPKILSHYFSHGVYRGIRRNKILMANSDQMVLQGSMAIKQVVDFLQGEKINRKQAPKIITIDINNLLTFELDNSLSPSNFKPQYEVN